MRTRQLVVGAFVAAWVASAGGQYADPYVAHRPGEGAFPLFTDGAPALIAVSDEDHAGVLRVAGHLRADLERVTGALPERVSVRPSGDAAVIVGTLGVSPLIGGLVKAGAFDATDLVGRTEMFITESIDSPWDNIDHVLVIAGSDKRGTIYGMYSLAENIGVSPWYYWADVPTERRDELHVLPGRHTDGEPKVRYRGIFINDEAPALSTWAHHTFNGFNAEFYDKVFELILRMRGNYLWPAMWGRSLFDDDPATAGLADEYGVIIGTSHHEPLMRAHVEWSRYGEGDWNYATNERTLREFWREGLERMGDYESIVTIGMRGDGDEAMSEETNIELLERIVADQRDMIRDVTGKPPEEVPQIWALYKEVQDYYDHGMRVPDDVTLLLCDDNWGNIRKLPRPGEPERAGGYGVYYHFDYVGGPRNYKWLNTNPLPRIWEQMLLAWEHGVDRIWIVNVGDIKPMELPTQFFLDMAWDPDAFPIERVGEYAHQWAAQQFPAGQRDEIGDLLERYAKINARRKPEMLGPETYSLTNYTEFESVVAEYAELTRRSQRVRERLPDQYEAAYYQVVHYPIEACANLNELYLTVAKNRLYAEQGRAGTNELADHAERLFAQDAELARIYMEDIADGKWHGMMLQTNIGYTYWQQPESDVMPEVIRIALPESNAFDVAVEGSRDTWSPGERTAVLPEITSIGAKRRWFEVFAKGDVPLDVSVSSPVDWLSVDRDNESGDTQHRYWIDIDREQAPLGEWRVPITVRSGDECVQVIAAVRTIDESGIAGFVETTGVISIEAEDFSRDVSTRGIEWRVLPDLGRTGSAVTTFPMTAPAQTPGGDSPRLEFDIHTFAHGNIDIHAYVSPTLDFYNQSGLRYAISVDGGTPQIVSLHPDTSNHAWEQMVGDNINITTTTHHLDEPGAHTVRFWMIDPGVVLQKIVIDTGGMQPSYLGPPPSPRLPADGARAASADSNRE